MKILDDYFLLFDAARTDETSRKQLINLFSDEICFILAGDKKNGLLEWNKFLDNIFTNNLDIKHMHEGWIFNSDTNKYQTNWAVCGKTSQGRVYVQTGIDIAELDQFGKIKYLENIPNNSDLFDKYK